MIPFLIPYLPILGRIVLFFSTIVLIFGTGYLKGREHGQEQFNQFVLEESVKSHVLARKSSQITQKSSSDYQKSKDKLKGYYDGFKATNGGIYKPYSLGSVLPRQGNNPGSDANPPGKPDGATCDLKADPNGVTAEEVAETTLQLLYLQDWITKQVELHKE